MSYVVNYYKEQRYTEHASLRDPLILVAHPRSYGYHLYGKLSVGKEINYILCIGPLITVMEFLDNGKPPGSIICLGDSKNIAISWFRVSNAFIIPASTWANATSELCSYLKPYWWRDVL